MNNKLVAFIVEAKKSTYAKQKPKEVSLPNGMKQLEFSKGPMQYRDRFKTYMDKKNFERFYGSEVVYDGKQRKWKMFYRGGMVSDMAPTADTFMFLKKAMSKVGTKRPFRGPRYFKLGNFEYRDNSKGNANKFEGVEKIFYNGKLLHIVKYKGGKINKRPRRNPRKFLF